MSRQRRNPLVITQRDTLASIRRAMPPARQIIESAVTKKRAKRVKRVDPPLNPPDFTD